MRWLVGEQGERGKEGEDCREEEAIPGSDILLFLVEEDEGDGSVDDDDGNRPDCVVAQEPAAEGKSSGSEEHMGKEVEGGRLQGVGEGGRGAFHWTSAHPPVDAPPCDWQDAERNPDIVKDHWVKTKDQRVITPALHNLPEDPCKEITCMFINH